MSSHTSGPLSIGNSTRPSADLNASVILREVRRSDAGVSRSELAELTRLAPQTISDVCARLIEQGLIAETGTVPRSGLGRPRKILNLVPESRFALGIHLDPASITYVVLNLTGEVIASVSHETRQTEDADLVMRLMAETLDQLIETAGVDRDRILGVGVAAPGQIDVTRGVIVNPIHLPGWREVELRGWLRQATGLPVLLDKDVTTAIVAERWAGAAQESANAAFVYLGTGIGIGSAVNDTVIRGSSGNAGEVGHLVTDVDGPLCPCGRRGCFGLACSPVHMIAEAVAAGVFERTPEGEQIITAVGRFRELCELADAGNEVVIEILHRAGRRLGRAVELVAEMLDLDLVIIGGPAWTPAAPYFEEVLSESVNAQFVQSPIHGVRVVGTELGEDVVAVGAACLVLDRTFSG